MMFVHDLLLKWIIASLIVVVCPTVYLEFVFLSTSQEKIIPQTESEFPLSFRRSKIDLLLDITFNLMKL